MELPRETATSNHLATLALFKVADADVETASNCLAAINDADLTPAFQFCAGLARAGVAFDRGAETDELVGHLREALGSGDSWKGRPWMNRYFQTWNSRYGKPFRQNKTLKAELKAIKASGKATTNQEKGGWGCAAFAFIYLLLRLIQWLLE